MLIDMHMFSRQVGQSVSPWLDSSYSSPCNIMMSKLVGGETTFSTLDVILTNVLGCLCQLPATFSVVGESIFEDSCCMVVNSFKCLFMAIQFTYTGIVRIIEVILMQSSFDILCDAP